MDPIKAIQAIPLFQNVPEENVASIYARMTGVEYPADTVILEEKGKARGIRGKDIPVCARFMAIADGYNALRSTRVYRASLSHEETRRIMIEGKGTQFDEHLLELFLRRENDFIRINRKLNEDTEKAK